MGERLFGPGGDADYDRDHYGGENATAQYVSRTVTASALAALSA